MKLTDFLSRLAWRRDFLSRVAWRQDFISRVALRRDFISRVAWRRDFYPHFALALLLGSTQLAADKIERRIEGALQLENVPAAQAADAKAMRPYLESRSGVVFGWLPHGDGALIGTRFGDTQQLHAVRAPMGARTQLTFEQEPILSAVINHNTGAPGMIYARDNGGDEQFQLYSYDLLMNETMLLTEGGGTRNERPVYAPDGFQFAYTRTDASGKYQIRMGDTREPGKTRRVFASPASDPRGTWYATDISRSGEKLLLQNFASVLDSNLIELDLKSGKRLSITAAGGVAARDAHYAPDGKSVFYLSDAGKEHIQLFRFDLATKKSTQISPHMLHDIEDFSLNSDASQVALNVNLDGSSEVQVYKLSDMSKPIASVAAKPSVITGMSFHPRLNRVLMALSSAQVAGDAFVLDTASSEITPWTKHEMGGLKSTDMILPDRIQYVGGSGKTIYNVQAFAYKPRSAGPHPVVVLIHGGPEAQSRPNFDAWVQYLVGELKVAVIAPNVRGSTGYGRLFTQMDDGIKRGDAVGDMGSLLDWIATQPHYDAKRVALMGGSYGGFMTLAGLVRYSDRLAGGVNTVGISDLATFLKNTSNYRRDLRRAEYGDERVPAIAKFFDTISPLQNADKIKAPLMVIQGANDPRVPASEATQIAAAVRANGKDVWTITATDEGHGFKKKSNIDRTRLAVAAFLRQHLLAP